MKIRYDEEADAIYIKLHNHNTYKKASVLSRGGNRDDGEIAITAKFCGPHR